MAEAVTPGQKAIGFSFIPNKDKVQRLKELAAEMFDIVEQSVPEADGTNETARKRKMRDAALHEIITAQMWAVKVVTQEGK